MVVGLAVGGATAGDEVDGVATVVVGDEPGSELLVVELGTVVVDTEGALVVLGEEVPGTVVVDAEGTVVELDEEAPGTVDVVVGAEDVLGEVTGTVEVATVVDGLGGGTILIKILGFGTTTVVDGVARVVEGAAGAVVVVVVDEVVVVEVVVDVVAGIVEPVGTDVVGTVELVVVVDVVVVLVDVVDVDVGEAVGVGALGGVPSVTQTMTWEIDLSPLRPPGSDAPLRFVSANTPWPPDGAMKTVLTW